MFFSSEETVSTKPRGPNQLDPEMLGISAINSFSMNVSATRGYMTTSHFTQHLVADNLEERIILSGTEKELSKYTLGVRMPENGRILKIIEKYPKDVGTDSLDFNPETMVIYQKTDPEFNGEIDCFVIPVYKSYHQYFGWKCVPREGLNKLHHKHTSRKEKSLLIHQELLMETVMLQVLMLTLLICLFHLLLKME